MSIIQTSASVTHTFGNVTCAIINYIKSYFKSDYFKTTHVSTRLSHKQLNTYRAVSEFWKNKKPMLIVKPRIELDDTSVGFYGTPLTTRMFNNNTNVVFECTPTLLENRQFGNMIKFQWNEGKMTFDVAVVVETFNEQINKSIMLKNALAPETPYYFQTPLEAYIPNGLIGKLADHLGVDRKDTREILFYLNTYAGTPITYKLKNGSGNNEFFMLYDTKVWVTPSQVTIDDGENLGMITDTYTISFSIDVEFKFPAIWYLFLQNKNMEYITIDTDDGDNKDVLVPMTSIPLRYDLKLSPGWTIYQAPCYYVDNTEKDITNVTSCIYKPFADFIKTMMKVGLEIPDSMVRFECYMDTWKLQLKKDYDIEIKEDDASDVGITINVITYACKPKVTYRLFIIINNFAINNVASDITGFNKEV